MNRKIILANIATLLAITQITAKDLSAEQLCSKLLATMNNNIQTLERYVINLEKASKVKIKIRSPRGFRRKSTKREITMPLPPLKKVTIDNMRLEIIKLTGELKLKLSQLVVQSFTNFRALDRLKNYFKKSNFEKIFQERVEKINNLFDTIRKYYTENVISAINRKLVKQLETIYKNNLEMIKQDIEEIQAFM